MKFSIFQETRQGGRHSNQDRSGYACTDGAILLVVCDGMGGHVGGELASQYVTEYVATMFRKYARPMLTDPASFLHRVMLGAHQGIIDYAHSQGFKETPRTTCVTCVIQQGKAWWSNVGDSRLYFIRKGSLVSKTTDHSYVQTLVDSGKISEQESKVHSERNKIFSCIGQEIPPKVDLYDAVVLSEGDCLLLSTDGLWSGLPIDFVGKVLSAKPIRIGVRMLVDSAEYVGGSDSDNITAIGIKWFGGSQSVQIVQEKQSLVDDQVTDFDVEVACEMLALKH